MKKILMFVSLLIFYTVVIHSGAYAQEKNYNVGDSKKLKFHPMSKGSSSVEVSLLNILYHYGKAYNCFFTIEEAHDGEEIVSPISSLLVELPQEEQEFDHNPLLALEQLQKMFPQFIFETSQNYPQVIHIVDGRLKKQANYGLSERIALVDFTGNSVQLIKEINRQVANVANPPFMFSHEFRDLTTITQVKGENLSVREILSNFIEPKKTDKVLWIARTKIGQNQKTYVYFPKH